MTIFEQIKAISFTCRSIEPAGFQTSLCLSPEFIGFAGHFPKQAILPAVVQILLARIFIQQIVGQEQDLKEVVQAKFLLPILPDKNLILSVHNKLQTWICNWKIDEHVAAKFTLILQDNNEYSSAKII